MNESIFVYSDEECISSISKMHICIWKFVDMSTLLELGFLLNIKSEMVSQDMIILNVHIPWFKHNDAIGDLYEHLHRPENSKFIFNDKVVSSSHFDGGKGASGAILSFEEGGALCLVPIDFTMDGSTVKISIPWYPAMSSKKCDNIYIRFYIQPKEDIISTRKPGIAKTTFIYDIRVNEQRNLPECLSQKTDLKLCHIENCYFLNIVPSVFDLTFLDLSCFKSARVLESKAFNDYIGSIKMIKKNELFVVFNKKKSEGNVSSYSCFSIFTQERLGPTQIIFAFVLNLLCGFLLFIPTYRDKLDASLFTSKFYINLPFEVYLALSAVIAFVAYLVWPKIFRMRRMK